MHHSDCAIGRRRVVALGNPEACPAVSAIIGARIGRSCSLPAGPGSVLGIPLGGGEGFTGPTSHPARIGTVPAVVASTGVTDALSASPARALVVPGERSIYVDVVEDASARDRPRGEPCAGERSSVVQIDEVLTWPGWQLRVHFTGFCKHLSGIKVARVFECPLITE